MKTPDSRLELEGSRAILFGFAHTFPGQSRLGRLPAQLADRRTGIWHAFEDGYLPAGFIKPAELGRWKWL